VLACITILRAVRDHPLVAVKSCHASGKTFSLAEIVLWWMMRWPDGIAITTSSSWEQVRREVWGEILKALRGSQIQFPVPNQTEMTLAPDCYALGLSTNDATRIQGFHGNHVLVVIDEAPGLDVAIWEAIESARPGGDTRNRSR
jgi:phage terminase large subunit